MKRSTVRRSVAAAVVAVAGLAFAPAPASAAPAAGLLEVYVDASFGGSGYAVTGYANNLTSYGINDKVSSLIAKSGCWLLFKDSDFRGASLRVDGLSYESNLVPYGFNDNISSIKPC